MQSRFPTTVLAHYVDTPEKQELVCRAGPMSLMLWRQYFANLDRGGVIEGQFYSARIAEGEAMSHPDYTYRTLYVGMHDGVCVLTSADAGQTWRQGPITWLAHAAARLAVSPTAPQRAYLAAYEAGVYRTTVAVGALVVGPVA